jgi:hypothetical protein
MDWLVIASTVTLGAGGTSKFSNRITWSTGNISKQEARYPSHIYSQTNTTENTHETYQGNNRGSNAVDIWEKPVNSDGHVPLSANRSEGPLGNSVSDTLKVSYNPSDWQSVADSIIHG